MRVLTDENQSLSVKVTNLDNDNNMLRARITELESALHTCEAKSASHEAVVDDLKFQNGKFRKTINSLRA